MSKSKETAVTKYYIIYEQYYAGNYFESKFVCIVENEEVAKHFCEKSPGYSYEEVKIKNEKLNCNGHEVNTITGNFMDFEINSINSSPPKTIISCEGYSSYGDTSAYDTEETIENCTVKLWSNSDTGKVKIGWWKNDD